MPDTPRGGEPTRRPVRTPPVSRCRGALNVALAALPFVLLLGVAAIGLWLGWGVLEQRLYH